MVYAVNSTPWIKVKKLINYQHVDSKIHYDIPAAFKKVEFSRAIEMVVDTIYSSKP